MSVTAASANAYNKHKHKVATKQVDFSADSFKVMLLKPGYTFGADHDLADLTAQEISDANYSAGGLTVDLTATAASAATSNKERITGDPASFNLASDKTAGNGIKHMALVNVTLSPALPVALYTFSAEQTGTAGTTIAPAGDATDGWCYF